MKPLEVQVEIFEDEDPEIQGNRPLLQRMADDKRNYFDRDSLSGGLFSYALTQK